MVINILIGILFIVVFYSVIKRSFLFPGAGIDNFMTKESTGSIKGFAIIMIAFSHICQDEPEIRQILLGGVKRIVCFFHGEQWECQFFSSFRDMVVFSR